MSATYLYELFDRDSSASNTNPEANFGLFNSDGTPEARRHCDSQPDDHSGR